VTEPAPSRIPDVIARHEPAILAEWLKRQSQELGRRRDLLSDRELEQQSAAFLAGMRRALEAGELDLSMGGWQAVKDQLSDLYVSRARQGFTPTETATLVF
jgi:rsbT co-antagonist protein RsbR